MIRTEKEYELMNRRLERDKSFISKQKDHFADMGLSKEEIELTMQPTLSFYAQLVEEVEAYEKMRHGDLGDIENLTNIGRWLIGARIAKGWSQKELSKKLGVSESQISRDEKNEYHNITIERAQKILDVLGVQFKAIVEKPIDEDCDIIEYAE